MQYRLMVPNLGGKPKKKTMFTATNVYFLRILFLLKSRIINRAR